MNDNKNSNSSNSSADILDHDPNPSLLIGEPGKGKTFSPGLGFLKGLLGKRETPATSSPDDSQNLHAGMASPSATVGNSPGGNESQTTPLPITSTGTTTSGESTPPPATHPTPTPPTTPTPPMPPMIKPLDPSVEVPGPTPDDHQSPDPFN